MKTRNILAGVLLATIITSWVGYSYANFKPIRPNLPIEQLTDEEKESLKDMTREEKREFFETKLEEHIAEVEARENVIDKLLAWEELTDEEEEIRQEIIEQRAQAKAKREERKEKMEEIKTILDKRDAWEELTDEEKDSLEQFMKNNRPNNLPKIKEIWKRVLPMLELTDEEKESLKDMTNQERRDFFKLKIEEKNAQ